MLTTGQICVLLKGYKQGNDWGTRGQRQALTAGSSPCRLQTRAWLLEIEKRQNRQKTLKKSQKNEVVSNTTCRLKDNHFWMFFFEKYGR